MPVDYSPLFAQVPESGQARGQRFFADALEAVMQRRQQADLQQQHLAAQAEQNRMQRELTGGYYHQMGEQFQQQEGRLKVEHEITAAQKEREIANASLHNRTEALRAGGEYARRNGGQSLGQAFLSPIFAGPNAVTAQRPPAAAAPPPPPQQQQPVTPPGTFAPPPDAGPGAVAPAPFDRDLTSMPLMLTGPGGAPPRPAPQPQPQALPPPAGQPPAAAGTQMPDLSGLAPEAQAQALRQRLGKLAPGMQSAVEGGLASVEGGGLDPQKFYSDVVKAQLDRESRERSARASGARQGTMSEGERVRHVENMMNGWRAERTAFEKETNLDKLTDARDRFVSAQYALDAYKNGDDSMAIRQVLYDLARYMVGPGTLQQREYNNTVTETKGWLPALKTRILKKIDGKIDPEETAAIAQFVEDSAAALRKRAADNVNSFDGRYHTGEHYHDGVPEAVQGYRQSLMALWDLDDEDVADSRSRRDTRKLGREGKRKEEDAAMVEQAQQAAPQAPAHPDDEALVQQAMSRGGRR